jgi:hypothetical protein
LILKYLFSHHCRSTNNNNNNNNNPKRNNRPKLTVKAIVGQTKIIESAALKRTTTRN